MSTTKVCGLCGVDKPLAEFYSVKAYRGRDPRQGWACKLCFLAYKNQYKSTPAQDRKAQLKYKYGLTIEEYTALLLRQGGRCAICNSASTKRTRSAYFAVDHNHETGKVRGLLCNNCNIGIGALEDSVTYLMNAVQYLEKTK